MTSSTKKDASGIPLIIIGAVLVIASLIFYLKDDGGAVAQIPDAPIDAAAQAPIAGDNALNTGAFDLAAAKAPRTLGSDEAPVKIIEYASLSCSHCAHFHDTTLPALKAGYIDTNQVQIIFTEFPLNAPALDGAMIARCLPADQYVPFTTMLFEQQKDWAFTEKYKDELQKRAAKFGMDKATFEHCLANEDLRQSLVGNMQAAARQWQINSTPSFVVNNETVISGAKDVQAFVPAIEKALTTAEPAAGETIEEMTSDSAAD